MYTIKKLSLHSVCSRIESAASFPPRKFSSFVLHTLFFSIYLLVVHKNESILGQLQCTKIHQPREKRKRRRKRIYLPTSFLEYRERNLYADNSASRNSELFAGWFSSTKNKMNCNFVPSWISFIFPFGFSSRSLRLTVWTLFRKIPSKRFTDYRKQQSPNFNSKEEISIERTFCIESSFIEILYGND